ncbi:MAG: hypothetical protein M1834_003492 [Cirrosporium novae-zelandiae]|nr:MAG: hypothetical protein M1834_003492 [Cirrosporium novae-zelandiae]
MSRPYQHNFETSRSPFDRDPRSNIPSPATPGSSVPSFKTDVHRSKTRKWVEAKSYNYDGDDWGDVDEYDEYGADGPEPEPEPNPVSKPTGLRQKGQNTQQGGFSDDTRPRANSFEAGDEQKGLSTTDSQQPRQNQAPPLKIQTQPQPSYDRPNNNDKQPQSSASVYSQDPWAASNRKQSMSSVVSTNFSPEPNSASSAMPRPLNPRRSETPLADQSAEKFPPRKSSLSHHGSHGAGFPKMETTPAQSKPGNVATTAATRERSASNQSITLVRPADIYKRMGEEREKERRSQESSRPSMDSILGGRGSDDGQSERGTDNSSRSQRRRPSLESANDGDSRRLRPMLEPVTERKSEYGFDGIIIPDPHTSGKAQERLDDRSATQNTLLLGNALPEIEGISSFGDEILQGSNSRPQIGNMAIARKLPPGLAPSQDIAVRQREIPKANSEQSASTNIQREPSSGFKSLVNQAFDQPDTVPPTPSSTTGGSVARTNTESTSGISPIMSGVPTNTAEAHAKTSEMELANPTIPEEANESSRPGSIANPRDITSTPPPGFKPGHRRNLSTPSPGNSPARSLVVQSSDSVVDGRPADITNESQDKVISTQTSESERNENDQSKKSQSRIGTVVENVRNSFISNRDSEALPQDRTSSPIARAESPTKGTVRNLAERFGVREGSRSSSPVPVSPKPIAETDTIPPRPVSERAESFRPALPGAWTSYATTTTETPEQEDKNFSSELSGSEIASGQKQTNLSPSRNQSLEALGENESTPTAAARSSSFPKSTSNTTADLSSTLVDNEILDANKLGNTGIPASTQGPKSGDSSVAPTPPPKDSSYLEHAGPDYFAVPSPLRPRSKDQNLSEDPTDRPQVFPSLSIDTVASDEESDRLRKLIVRSLNPLDSSESPSPHSSTLDHGEQRLSTGSEEPQGRESTVLPEEYESYWNSPPDQLSTGKVSTPLGDSNPWADGEGKPAPPGLRNVSSPSTSQPPTESSRFLEPTRPQNTHRFSWEADTSEALNVGAETIQPGSVEHETRIPPTEPTLESCREPQVEGNTPENIDNAIPQAARNDMSTPSNDVAMEATFPAYEAANIATNRQDSALPEVVEPQEPHSMGEDSTAEVPTPPTPQSPSGGLPKIMSFREILALQDPDERIKAFAASRRAHLDMERGLLGEWVEAASRQLPGQEDMPPVTGKKHRFSKHNLGEASTDANRTTSGSSQNPPIGVVRLTSLQVQAQAKGKDLLHTAGIFGGKANTKAKGLFSKGKARFRGSGNTEKVSPASPPKQGGGPLSPKERLASSASRLSRVLLPHKTEVEHPLNSYLLETVRRDGEDTTPEASKDVAGNLPGPSTTEEGPIIQGNSTELTESAKPTTEPSVRVWADSDEPNSTEDISTDPNNPSLLQNEQAIRKSSLQLVESSTPVPEQSRLSPAPSEISQQQTSYLKSREVSPMRGDEQVSRDPSPEVGDPSTRDHPSQHITPGNPEPSTDDNNNNSIVAISQAETQNSHPLNYYNPPHSSALDSSSQHHPKEDHISSTSRPLSDQTFQTAKRSTGFFRIRKNSAANIDVVAAEAGAASGSNASPRNSKDRLQKLTKRSSILWSAGSNNAANSIGEGRSSESITPKATEQSHDLHRSQTRLIVSNERPNGDPTRKDSKLKGDKRIRNRLHRSSASTSSIPDEAKKKRFHNLGGLFGRPSISGRLSKSPLNSHSEPSRPPELPNPIPTPIDEEQSYFPPGPWSSGQLVQGQPPPPDGYYAPDRSIPDPNAFIGGRRLSEERVARAKHRHIVQEGHVDSSAPPPHQFEGGYGYDPRLQRPHNQTTYHSPNINDHSTQAGHDSARIPTSSPRGRHHSTQFLPSSPRLDYRYHNPTRYRTPLENAPQFSDNGVSIQPVPAQNLGTFGLSGMPLEEQSRQERPWSLSLPGLQASDEDVRRTNRPQARNYEDPRTSQTPPSRIVHDPSDYPLPNSPRVTSPVNPQAMDLPPPPPPKILLSYQQQYQKQQDHANSSPHPSLKVQIPPSHSRSPSPFQIGTEGTTPQPQSQDQQPQDIHERQATPQPQSLENGPQNPQFHIKSVTAQPVELDARDDRLRRDDSSEEIIMSPTAYPGQEWVPRGINHWEAE